MYGSLEKKRTRTCRKEKQLILSRIEAVIVVNKRKKRKVGNCQSLSVKLTLSQIGDLRVDHM